MDELPYEEQEYIINSGVEIDNELREEGDDEPPSMDEMEDVEGEDEEETGVVDVEEDEGDDEDEEDTTEQDDDNVLNFGMLLCTSIEPIDSNCIMNKIVVVDHDPTIYFCIFI